MFKFSRNFQGVDAFSRTFQGPCEPWMQSDKHRYTKSYSWVGHACAFVQTLGTQFLYMQLLQVLIIVSLCYFYLSWPAFVILYKFWLYSTELTIRCGEWYLEKRGSRKILAGSRNLESVFGKSRSLVFAWFDFYFSWVSKLLTKESRARIFK